MKAILRTTACALCLAMAATAFGCAPRSTTTITPEAEDATTSGGITPLERGEIRRLAEAGAREAVDAWVSGDREAFANHFGELPQQLMFERWDEAEAAGQTIDRAHEFISVDVYEMNEIGTQALAKYRFNDNTIVTDASGNVLESGDGTFTEFQFTLEPVEAGSDDWIVVRMLGDTDAVR